MDREKQIMIVLNHLNDLNTNFNQNSLGLSLEQFASLIKGMQQDNLISNICIQYADNKPYYINLEDARITVNGIEYLKNINIIIENDILQILYDNMYESALSDGSIKKDLFIHSKSKVVESYMKVLINKDLVYIEKKRVAGYKHPTNKEFNTPATTIEKFRISQNGIKYVENGFKNTGDNNFSTIVKDKITEIADTTAQMNQSLNSIARTFDITLNAMGTQHQKSIQKQIETDKLLEEYIHLLKSREPEKENRIISFLSKLSGDIVIGLIIEASKKLIS